MFSWGRVHYRSPPLRPCRSVSDRLRIALLRSNLDDFWALVEEGADINTRYRCNRTPLHLVIDWKKDLAIVKAVLSAGADPNAVDNRGHTPLHAAIHSNSGAAIIEALLLAGSEIDKLDSRGRSPLIKCIDHNNNINVIRTLLSAGANINIANLMVKAIKAKTDSEVIRLFIMAGVSVNYSSTAFPPISYAVLKGDLKVVKLLLEAGARIDFLHPENRCTLLHQARVAGVAQELIQHGMDVNAVNNQGETPLHTAVKNDLPDVALTMINAGADVQRLVQGIEDNCLHLARSKKMVRLLASHGVDINSRNMQGWSPLPTLVTVCYLLSFSLFRFSDRYTRNYSLSYVKKMNKFQSAVKEMLKCGADVNAVDGIGVTVLETAIKIGNPKIILYMIKHGLHVCWPRLFSIIYLADRSIIELLIRESVFGNVNGENVIDYLVESQITQSLETLFMYALQCKAEIELMKVEKINCNNTIYHYVIEITPKINAARLCCHYDINDEEYASKFPIYKNKISVRLNKCYKRAGMIDVLENIDVSAPTADGKEVSLINDCKFAIAEFLSNNELVCFLLAMGMKVSKDGVWPKSMNCGDKSPPTNT